MSDMINITAAMRDGVGKGSARANRRQGLVPAVIYGDKKAPVSITVESRSLERIYHRGGFFTNIFEIEIDGKAHRVLARDAQLHPVKDTIMHVDFLRVSAKTRVTVEVPVTFLNEATCPGIKTGGVLNIVRREVELVCPADAIPETIELDLGAVQAGESVHISAISLPKGITPAITDRDFTICSIAAPSGGGQSETEETADEAAEGDGEEES
ncbi:MAG: 50S ribosomal protein L25/general stress protein Ctc [Rhodospirillaceae bacterium]